MVRYGTPGLPEARLLVPLVAAPTAAFPLPGAVLPGRGAVRFPVSAPSPARHPDRRAPGHTTSGKILVAAVAVGAVVPAVQALGVSHAAEAESGASTAQLSAAQMSLAAQQGAARAASPASAAISDVTTISMSAAQLASADPNTAVDALEKSMSVAREAGPAKFGRPYVAGGDDTLDDQIAKALGLMGLPQKLAPGVKKIIMRESTGNPDAINDWDSNAAAGTPSKGLMQLIDTTFRNAVLPSLASKGIYDPVANITAGVRTMIANHGIDAVMDGGLRNSSGGYIGYGGAKLPDDGLG